MRLSDFIRQSLSEIALGVAEAKSLTRDLISIAPGSLNGEIITEKSTVDFEVAVTAKESKLSKGTVGGKLGFEVSVLGAKVGLDGSADKEGNSSTENEQVSKLKFSVPVYPNAHHRGPDKTGNEELEAITELKKQLKISETTDDL